MQKTDTSRPSRVKVTRIQKSCFHTCIRQPASGVAETSSAEEGPRSRTTRPPETEYPFTFPAALSPGSGGGGGVGGDADFGFAAGADGDGVADGDADGDAEADGPGSGEGGGGSGCCVEEASGTVVSGTASGGS